MTTIYRSNTYILRKNRVNITSGNFKPTNLFLCVSDGDLTVNWKDGTSSVVTCASGEPYTFEKDEAESVDVTSGTFHLG